ncbi:MAG: RnfABCDGE type electron transport complex subunit D [Treponema sp.]|nr:RnfABCDGE type electron transport complex subunit D [Treponema sp.]
MKKNELRFQTVSLRPYKMLSTSMHVRLYFMLAMLLVQTGMLFVTKSWDSLWIILSAVCASEIAETTELFQRPRHIFNWTNSLVSGIIIGFFIPSTYPPMAVFFITLIISLVCRWLLGNNPNSWVNPVAFTVAVCWLIGMNLFPLFTVTPVILQAKNPSALLLQNGTFPILPVDSAITSFVNQKLFGFLNVSIPDGFVTLLWDTQAVIPAFRFNALTLLSSILLIAFDVVNPVIPAVFLSVYLLLVRILTPIFYGGLFGQGDILLALLTSGTLFSAFFLLPWTGTTPQLKAGKICYGIAGGVVAFLIVGCGVSAAGSVFTVLVLNVISSMIQAVETLYTDQYVSSVLIPHSRNLEQEGIHA